MEINVGTLNVNLRKFGESVGVKATFPRGAGVQEISEEQVVGNGCSTESESKATFKANMDKKG